MDESLPSNPAVGKTLIVDSAGPRCYPLLSDALRDAAEPDQIYVRPGTYEDKIFILDRPVRLIGAGGDQVQIFSRRGAPVYLQQVPGGRI